MVEFVASNARRRLNELAIHSIKINAAVCYWTMPPAEFCPEFLSALKHKDSCLVVDIHSPTSIDSLAEFNRAKANVFLYLFQIVGKTETPDSKGIPDHLMHAKVFVFDYGTNEIKIWVGSHNGTRRAMLGLNFELATVITCERNSVDHLKALQFIEQIKKISSVFKQSEIDLYRSIQRIAAADAFIELTDSQVTPLKRSSMISIFGKKDSDYTQLQKVGKKIYLSITNSISGDETIYKASVYQSGYLDKQSQSNKQKKTSLIFDKRRFAVKLNTTVPMLEPEQAVPKSIYSNCRYFVTLKVEKALVDFDAFEAPTEHLWEDVDKQLYLEGAAQPISDDALVISKDQEVGQYRIQGVNLGQAKSIFTTDPISDMDRTLKVLTLTERNSLPDQPLIRRRLLVSRSGSDTNIENEITEI